jgi:hypothetical protein
MEPSEAVRKVASYGSFLRDITAFNGLVDGPPEKGHSFLRAPEDIVIQEPQ